MKRVLLLLSALALCLAGAGCSEPDSTSGIGIPDAPTQVEASALIEALGDGESATFDNVTMTQSTGYSTEAGTHEDEIAQSGCKRVDIGVIEWIDAIETDLTSNASPIIT